MKKEIGALPGIDKEHWWSVAFIVVVELDVFSPSSSITRLRDIYFQ
jgi:hypothetical protein